MASCSLNQIDEPLDLVGKTVPVTITAKQADGNETKTIRNADKSVYWMPAENILVICGDDKAEFISTNTENLPTVSFNGELDEATVNAVSNGTSSYPVWGLYPYDENAESDGTTYVTTTLPANQTGVAGTFADDLFITLAKSNDFNLYFYNVCSGFKFSVTKAGITSITIQGKNNEYLAGKVKLSFGEDGKPKVDEVLDGEKTITLTPEKSTFEVGKDYYFVTLPTPFTSGFTVTFNTPTETGTFDVSATVSFSRSKFVSKSNIDAAVVFAAKEGNIPIPDANFKAYCVANFDSGGDGEISYSEALEVTVINVNTDNIESLKGIEFFTNILSLTCSGSSIWDSYRFDYNGKLSSLDITKNTALTKLNCSGNQLTSLDVSKNDKLTSLSCHSNRLETLNLSNNIKLEWLQCENNQLSVLNISNISSLKWVYCHKNLLSVLDVSQNTKLYDLTVSDNLISSIDVSNNTALWQLDCGGNQLSAIDVTNNTSLAQFNCSGNHITELIVSQNTALNTLSCADNQLTVLDVSKNTALTFLSCGGNQLTELDISKNTALTHLECSNNQISELNISNNLSLVQLTCTNNNLSELDVSNRQAIVNCFCEGNQLSSLNITNCAELFEVRCDNNHLTSLSISDCPVLTNITCINNSLSSLVVDNCPSFETLDCESNLLSSLDLSDCSLLTALVCSSNPLTTLDVSKNSAMETLICTSCPLLTEIWLKTGQTITDFQYDTSVATVKYKE